MRTSDRWAFVCLVVGVAVILGAVQLSAMLDKPPEALAPEADFCPDRPGGAAHPETGYKETAAPYRGGGPHPVALVPMDADIGGLDIPATWKAAGAAPKVQLVGCVYQDIVASKAEKGRTCSYSALPAHLGYQLRSRSDRSSKVVEVSLLEARYTVGVYEAGSAKQVGRFTVPGAAACPSRYKLDSGGVIAQEPDPGKLRAALRPYVERPVNGRAAPRPEPCGTSMIRWCSEPG
ncbi:hypothetical protein ACFVH6_37595 [Spirillospora sp. NPDC127200]